MKTLLGDAFAQGLISISIIIAICLGLFLVLRAVVLWYWKIDKLVANQETQIRLLKKLNSTIQQVKAKQPVA